MSLASGMRPSSPESVVRHDADHTDDALLGGRGTYRQPARGDRVALEAPLLARFALGARPAAHVVDLGAGPGAIGLMLLATGWAHRATGVEPNVVHAALARYNAAENRVALTVDERSVAQLRRAAHGASIDRADLVIANPPYFSLDRDDCEADARARSRALVDVSIEDFARAARHLLGSGGRFVVAFPSNRLVELLAALDAVGLPAKRARFVRPRAGREAQVVFVEAKPGRPGGLAIEPALYVRERGDGYTGDVDDALRGVWPRPRAK